MIKYTKVFILLLLAVSAFRASAQTNATTSSPYSRYGLGDIDQAVMPQQRGMGNIGAAINKINNYNTINVLNPASYSEINYTTFDIGVYGNSIGLSQTGQTSTRNGNFRLSHVNFAVPVSRRSALSFGLMPYSEMGYNFKQTRPNFGTGLPIDTSRVNYLYTGDGGLSRAYLGYGFGFGPHFRIGANASYIFGNLIQNSSTEVIQPDGTPLYGTLNSRIEQSRSVGGLSYDLGVQYSIDWANSTKHVTFGYSTSLAGNVSNHESNVVYHYIYDASGNQKTPIDSVTNRQDAKTLIRLPNINHFGVSYQYDNHFLVGADFTMGNWSNLSINGVNQGFQNSKTYSIGGQYTPNNNALRNYFQRIDYRLGFIYDQTYLSLNNTNVNRTAVTLGLGLPLAPSQTLSTFYKINVSAEIGKRGTLDNGLVKENYVNIHLGFTLNDKWFQKYQFH
ncbi:hypothetical protein [Mucilaginibacter sp. L3T2-6]|uniref:hypothetical protein n=1 Tax=Mucilaginibacter sp. L3T2-6 TaxID=3062491 RepID=UPI00267525E7|nr:hypothetical protein [Mucilaginibacter sp. L3T2-6]MDO3640690.1 hypothetical protein [Mucilaginibacter sp. L3T2-6]MDV6212970.1 hypothetical protein [Mucilaginibacter sp. L3T2-6]